MRPFRRRLTLAFILVAVAVAAVISVATLTSVRAYRYRTFKSRAVDETDLALRLTPADVTPARLGQLLAFAGTRSSIETVAVAPAHVLTSNPVVTLDRVPPSLRNPAVGETKTGEVTIAGTRYFVVGGRNATGVRLFVFFAMTGLTESLRQFTAALVVTAVIVTAAASAVGSSISRRTLRPVRHASLEARDLAGHLAGVHVPPASGDEFASWIESFNLVAKALADRIEELSVARERERVFTSDVAHELRTPVASLVTAASLLEEDAHVLPVEQRRTIEILARESRRLRSLLADIMELSRFDAGMADVTVEEVDLAGTVRAACSVAAPHTRVDLRLAPVCIQTDRRRLERILENVIRNAVEHGQRGVEIVVSAHDAGAVVTVLDRGPGIPPENLTRIFDRFFQLDSSRTGRSTGVGLAIAKENADILGGRLTAANRVGGGSEFELVLPKTVGATPAPRPMRPSALGAVGASGTTSVTPSSG